MKNILKVGALLVTIAVSGMVAATPVAAQDFFGSTVPLLVGTPGVVAATTGIVTNGPVDLTGYIDRCDLIIDTCTNGAGTATNTVAVQFSSDNTNWVALTSYALISSATSKSITNYWVYGGSNVVSQSYLLPFTSTSPTAYTAGFNTPYAAPVPFTNTAATVSITAKGMYVIGFSAKDSLRYMQVIFNLAGTSSTNGNTFVSAKVIGNRSVYPY